MTKLGFVLGLMLVSISVSAKVYRIGVVPQFEAQRIQGIWRPILARLGEETGDEYRLEQAESIPAFEQAFLRGDYDFAYMNPWHAVMAYQGQQYRPILRGADRKLKGILVVKKGGPIQRLDQLKGQVIAFPAPNALGASLLMRAELSKRHGIDFTPRYVGTHSSAYLNVALDKTAAGGGVRRTLGEQTPALQDKLHVLYQTRGVNPHPIVVHPRVEGESVVAFIEAAIAVSATSQGSALFSEIPMTRLMQTNIDDYLMLKAWGLDEFYAR